MIKTEKITYHDEELTYEGFVAYNDKANKKLPAIMIIHAFGGLSSFEEDKAVELAKQGYFSFAIDIYGKGVRAKTTDEAFELMNQLNANRLLLLQRVKTALAICKSFKHVDENKIGAIGYCFGGKAVLDLARSGEILKGVVSFHGLLDAPTENSNTKVETPILIQHGWDDPLVKPNDVIKITEELNHKNADWEINTFSNTGHGFTNPTSLTAAKNPNYNPASDRKSWNRMLHFFNDQFNH